MKSLIFILVCVLCFQRQSLIDLYLSIHRGGLADQLSRLQARERSSLRMWSHQQNKSASSSQGIGIKEFIIKEFRGYSSCCLLYSKVHKYWDP